MINRQEVIFATICIVILAIFSLLTISNLRNIDNEVETLFSVHIIVPTNNPLRMEYTPLIANELPKIGISAEIDYINYAVMPIHAINKQLEMYSDGGYDIIFLRMNMGTSSSHPGEFIMKLFSTDGIPPTGHNFPYWSNITGENYNTLRAQENEDLIARIQSELNMSLADELIDDLQRLWYDVMPNILIYNTIKIHAVSAGFYGYDPLFNPLYFIEDQWFTGYEDTVVFAVDRGPETLNSIQTTDIYSLYSAPIPMDSLVGYTPSGEIVLPTGTDRDLWMMENYGTTVNFALYPRMAEDIGAFSDDGLQYNIIVRDDIHWHDGHQFDAWDVAFSFQARLVPAIDASVYSNLLTPFGKDDKTTMSGNYSFIVEDKNSDGFYEAISIQFLNKFAPWTTDYLGSLIYPEHILGDPINHGFDGSGNFNFTQWNIPPNNWRSHSTSTGRTTDEGGYPGPIGTGSMIFKEYNTSSKTVTLEKFEDIIWNGTSWAENTSNDFYNIDNLTTMPTTAKLIAYDLNTTIEELRSNFVNIIDPLNTPQNLITDQWQTEFQTTITLDTDWQALYMNPKFNQDGIYHFLKKGVRHAISHVIPRFGITQLLFDGLGIPAYTPLPPTSWAAISEKDMISYKQSLTASDGSKPLICATTAYDKYSVPSHLIGLKLKVMM